MEPAPVPQPPRLIDLLGRACDFASFRALFMRFLRACGAASARGQPRTAAGDKQDEEQMKAAKKSEADKQYEEQMKEAKKAKADKKREKKREKTQRRNADNAANEAAAKKAKKDAKKTAKAAAEAADKAAVLDEAAIAKSIASTSAKAGRAPNPGHHALDGACASNTAKTASPRDRAPNAARTLKAAADSNSRAKDAPSQSATKAGRATEPGHHALDRACAAKDARNIAAKNKVQTAKTVFAASPRDGAPNAARALKAAGHSNGRDKDAPSQSAATSASPAPAGPSCSTSTPRPQPEEEELSHSNGRDKDAPSQSAATSASPAPARPSCSTSTPRPQPEEEELSHLSYWKENQKVKHKDVTPCMMCFLDPESKLRDYANTDADIRRHVKRFHKGGVKHCAQKGCFVIGKDRQQIGMHQFYAHKK
ncbi:hypothetical protein ACQ4PT_016277 [Festuca glaucescens]